MDFDGTLLTSDKQVTEKTRQTLIELKEKDYIIIGITARILPSVKNVCDISMFDYLILNNGNSLYDVKNKKDIYLVTCKKNDKSKRLVVIFKLKSVKNVEK